jgi:hypothetical protein
MVQVRVTNNSGTNILVKPFQIVNGVAVDLAKYTNVCGANNWYYWNSTIEFVVNGKSNCQVRLTVSNILQLTMRLQIDITTFYLNKGDLSFLSKLSAFLGIDPGRIKIVSVNPGSAIITSAVTTSTSNCNLTYSSNSTDNFTDYMISNCSNINQDANELKNISNSIQTGLNNGSLKFDSPVLNYSSTIIVID